jgi:hypothetical protein
LVIVEYRLAALVTCHVGNLSIISSIYYSPQQRESNAGIVRLANYRVVSNAALLATVAINQPLQLIPSHPSLHSHGELSSLRGRRCSPSARESHSSSRRCQSTSTFLTESIRGVKQSIPAHPGGHLHCPSYWLHSAYCPHVKTGSMQLKQGGHFAASRLEHIALKAPRGLRGGIISERTL